MWIHCMNLYCTHTHTHIEKNKKLQLTGSSQGLILNILSLHVVTCHVHDTLNDSITSAYMDMCAKIHLYMYMHPECPPHTNKRVFGIHNIIK